MNASEEWLWAGLIIAAPFVVFLALELAMAHRRRRQESVARRRKSSDQYRRVK